MCGQDRWSGGGLRYLRFRHWLGAVATMTGVSVQGRRARLWLAFMTEAWTGFLDEPVLLFGLALEKWRAF